MPPEQIFLLNQASSSNLRSKRSYGDKRVIKDLPKTVFILGIGAHKGGTTWLADQFKKAGAKFPLGKEAHIWDAIEQQESGELAGAAWLTKEKPKRKRESRVTRERKKIRNSPGNYSSYYHNFAEQNKINFVGDITPLYSALSIETLTRIRRGLVDEGFRIKVFFSARDPYSRIWSAVRAQTKRKHKSKLKNSSSSHSLTAQNAQSQLEVNYKRASCKNRTRYDLIVPKLKEVFAGDELKICFFEELITQQGYADLASFIGLASTHAETDSPSRVSPSIEEPDHELKKAIINHYSETYEYMMKVFPRSKKLWADSIGLLEKRI